MDCGLLLVFVSWGLQRFIRENKSEERRACAAQRASRAARALRARVGGWGAAGMGEGVLEIRPHPALRRLRTRLALFLIFFVVFGELWLVRVLGKNAP